MARSTKIIFFISFVLILLDQVSKQMIYNYFQVQHINNEYYVISQEKPEIKIIGEVVKFVYVENAGMAFGIQFGEFKIFLSIFSIIASILIGILLHKISESPFVIQLAFGLIFAGAVGNLIDRVFYGVIFNYAPLFYGRVIDFIQVDIPDIRIGNIINYTHWPVFNVADSCVSIGVVLLLIFNKHIPSFSSLFRQGNPKVEPGDGAN